MLRTVAATRYVTPLREGGSLPAIIEADDDGLYVLKFRGAGQGPKALLAELLGAEIGRALGLPIPEVVFVDLDAEFGRNELDPEIRELLIASAGLNLGVDYLPGSLSLDPVSLQAFDPALAARTAWFDAFIMNVDRTLKNPNILLWHREPWFIDHGAAFYFHHTWDGWETRAQSAFPAIRDHVLLGRAASITGAGSMAERVLTPSLLAEITALLPDEWLVDVPFGDPAATRNAYLRYLELRLAHREIFEQEAERARAQRL